MLRRLALIAALALSSAMAAPQAARAQMDPRDLEICKQQCLSRASSHADPRYTSCVRSRCQGQPARRSSGSTQRKSAPRTSASGLSCAPEGVALRATNGLFRGPVLGWITDTGSAGGSIPLTPGAAYSESRGAACALGVAGLGSASALILVDVPVTARGPGAGFALDLPGGPVAVMSGAEVQARLPGTRSLPAQGLASGLAALAASCPALAEALRSPCP